MDLLAKHVRWHATTAILLELLMIASTVLLDTIFSLQALCVLLLAHQVLLGTSDLKRAQVILHMT